MPSTVGALMGREHPRVLGSLAAGADRAAAYARDVDATARRIVRLCDAGAVDALTLRKQLLAEIRTVIGFQAHVWLLTDPETSVGASPLADVPPPLLAHLSGLIRLKYLTDVNRWTTLDSGPALLHQTTGGELARSLLWRSLLRNYSIVDLASLVFRDRFGCWGFLDLWRVGEVAPFDQNEARFLAGIVEPITGALRRCQAETFVNRVDPEPHRVGPVVLLLSSELDVLGQTPHTAEYLNVLVPPDKGRDPIPAGAYNVAAQLLANEAGIDHNPAAARVHLSQGRWLSLRAARLGDEEKSNIAVTIEEAGPAERTTLFARCCGLSPRETELLTLLTTGLDTRGLARALYVSEHTVQDHLKSIFAKTTTRTRSSLLSRALGT
jgi:DNA-binding NarL/FixJ family response regulator